MNLVPEDLALPEGHTRWGHFSIALKMFVAKQPNPNLAAILNLEEFPLKRRNFCKKVLVAELKAGRIRAWGCIDATHVLMIRGSSMECTEKNEEHQCALDLRQFASGQLNFANCTLQLESAETLGFPDKSDESKLDWCIAWYHNINLDMDDVRNLFLKRKSRRRGAPGYGSKWSRAENALKALPAAKRTFEEAAKIAESCGIESCPSQVYLRLGHIIRTRHSDVQKSVKEHELVDSDN